MFCGAAFDKYVDAFQQQYNVLLSFGNVYCRFGATQVLTMDTKGISFNIFQFLLVTLRHVINFSSQTTKRCDVFTLSETGANTIYLTESNWRILNTLVLIAVESPTVVTMKGKTLQS